MLLFILHQHLHTKTETASDFIIRTWKICQHSAVLHTAAFFGDFVFSVFGRKVNPVPRNFYISASTTVNLCPALCQPLTRLGIISVLPSLTSLPLKSSHSHTPLHLKQVNTHTRTASRLLIPGWFWIHDKEASLSLNIKVLHLWAYRHGSLPGSATLPACWLWVQPPRCSRNYWRTVSSQCSEQNLTVFTTIDCLGSAHFRCSEMLFSNGSVFDRKKTVWEMCNLATSSLWL